MRRIAPRVLLVSVDAPQLEEPGSICLPELPAAGNERSVFGDGSHPTTRLCAGAVDLLCRQRKVGAVLDVGTGTGVLARIARAHGAEFVVGTDVDPLALEWAKKQCDLDGAAVEVLLAAASPDAWGPRFDLIVANIL